ncbi:MAG: alpha-L-fucosidase [Bacteroidales bacterium]
MQSRRNFIKLSTLAGASILCGAMSCSDDNGQSPYWLQNKKEDLQHTPSQTALQWFKNAHFGLFIHYGLYSILGQGEWVQFVKKIPVKEYEKLTEQFTASNFDADQITDLAAKAGMKYINLVVKHHDSFCLWDTQLSDFKSTNTPAKRDLLGEFSTQCKQKGLPLFLCYSLGRDWRHPNAPNRDAYLSFSTRPAYEPPETEYKYGSEHKLEDYVDFAFKQVDELMCNYGDIAGVSFGGSSTLLSGSIEPFRLDDLYKMIKQRQAHTLITNGQGVNGKEDYVSALRKAKTATNTQKFVEVCDTLQSSAWGYSRREDKKHKSASEVIDIYQSIRNGGGNLLLNIGPLADGAVHSKDKETLAQLSDFNIT